MSGPSPLTYRTDDLWRQVATALTEHGFTVSRAHQQRTLSIGVTPRGIVLGLNPRADALADWPGGRVRLAKAGGRISRAEFKLEELFQLFNLSLPAGGTALDLGASPGGLTVWAIDPGALDPRITTDPGVHHVRTTAGRFLAETNLTFDLILNDMRMTAERSCEVMLAATRHLTPGALAILTLKISSHAPLTTIHQALGTLQRSYQITYARQLHHNRKEITVVAHYSI